MRDSLGNRDPIPSSQNTKHTPHCLPSNLFICIFAPTAVNGISLNLVRFTFNYTEKKPDSQNSECFFSECIHYGPKRFSSTKSNPYKYNVKRCDRKQERLVQDGTQTLPSWDLYSVITPIMVPGTPTATRARISIRVKAASASL